MSQFTHYPIKFGPLPIYATAALLPPFAIDGDTAVVSDTNTIYVYDTTGPGWVAVASPSGAIAIDGLTGDVSASGPGVVPATINANVVTNAKLAQMANNTVKGNKSGGTANASDLALSDVVETGSSILTITNGSKSVVSASNLSIQVQLADATHSGYLSLTDWNTFNNKQAAGNYITALTGDATAAGPGSAVLTLATVNAGPGTFGTASQVGTFTVNGKGLVTSSSNTPIQITESQVTNLTTDLAGKLSTSLTSAHIFVGNGSNVATDTAMSGDISISNAGVTTIANNAVTTAKINNDAVTTAKILNNNVTNAKLAQMANNTIKGRFTAGTGDPEDLTPANVRSLTVTSRLSFVFQPGGTDTHLTGGNTYTDWATLYTAISTAQGARMIGFDDTFATCTIPSGTYNLSGVTFVGANFANTSTLVVCADGCVFTAFPSLNSIQLISDSTTPVFTITSGSAIIDLDNISAIAGSNTTELIKVDNTSGDIDTVIILLNTASNVSNSPANNTINLVNNGSILLYAGFVCAVDSNSIAGDASAFVIGIYAVGSASISTTQVNLAGTFLTQLSDAALYHQYNNSSSGLLNENVQGALDELTSGVLSRQNIVPTNGGSATISNSKGLVQLKPAGVIPTYTLTMPASPYNMQMVRIANGNGGAITALTLSANTGQTITNAVVTLVAGGFAAYQYDSGDTNWYRCG